MRRRGTFRVLMFGTLAGLLLGLGGCGVALAQQGKLVREKVHGKSLEGNATGDAADRWVSVYLPPSYATSPNKRYPVLYLLHGIVDTDRNWTRQKKAWRNIQSVMNRGIARGWFGEMIVVMPNQRTKGFGSWYVNSAATGKWEDFTVKELVSSIDSRYRTLAKPESRGIGGHSMGGYGAISLGMKHPEVFSVVYGMSPAILGWGGDLTLQNPAFRAVLRAKSVRELFKRTRSDPRGEYKAGILSIAQAFSPNPKKPPFFADFPSRVVGGRLLPAEPAFGRWEAHFPLRMVARYRANLMKLRGLRFDSGYQDRFTHIPVTTRALSSRLTGHGVPHVFEEYNGNHYNRVWGVGGRMATEVLPYFWRLLDKR